MRSPNYDKYPATRTEGALFHGWDAIREALDRERRGPLAAPVCMKMKSSAACCPVSAGSSGCAT